MSDTRKRKAKKLLIKIIAGSVVIVSIFAFKSKPTLKFALLKYNGGGDWYNDVNSLKNLAIFCNKNLGTSFETEYATVEAGSPEIFNHPIRLHDRSW